MNLRGPWNRIGAFEIASCGNGLIFQIVRNADGATVLLQGDDAIRLGEELDETTEHFTEEDVAAQYFA